MIITKRRFHTILGLLSFLSFFAPVKIGATTQIAAIYFLMTGTVFILTNSIPAILEPFRVLFQESLDLGLMLLLLLFFSMAIASMFYFYAILFLIAWSFFFQFTNSATWRKLYRIWLLLSLASSLSMSLMPIYIYGRGLGFWLNPILLLLAAVGEFWVFRRVER
jgi:hypothetical protein